MNSTTGSLDREALDYAAIRIQPDGRLLHISRDTKPESKSKTEHEGGSTAEAVALHSPKNPDEPLGSEKITGFSANSRRRLRRTVHSLRRDADCLFVTLTYHETRPSPDEAKEDLDRFCVALKRALPDIGIVWKMEPQERGVPHFHLLVYGVTYIPITLLVDTWHRITNEVSAEHARSGVDIERGVNEDGKLQVYLTKYMAEEYDGWPGDDERWEETGRWWGVRYKDALPWAAWEEEAVYLSDREAQHLIRYLLDAWNVDILDGVLPPSLTVCCRGNPETQLDAFLRRLRE